MNFEEPIMDDPAQKDDIGLAAVAEAGVDEGKLASEKAPESPVTSTMEQLNKEAVVQVRGETDPAVVEDFLLDAQGKKVIAHVRNMRTGAKRDVAIDDILRVIENAKVGDGELNIAGTVTAEIANDEIESWADKGKN